MRMSFIVITDYLALCALRTKEELFRKMQRYDKKFLTFDYNSHYRPGNENFPPDLCRDHLLSLASYDDCYN